jgi:hypothetical protein
LFPPPMGIPAAGIFIFLSLVFVILEEEEE